MSRTGNSAALELVSDAPREETPPQKDGCPPCPPCVSSTNNWLWLAGAAAAGWYLKGRME